MEELLIIIFLLLGPILDVLAFYNLPVNIIFRGIYLVCIIFLMLKKKENIKYLIVLTIFSLVLFLYQQLSLDYSLTTNISNIFKFIYLPCSLLYFKDFKFSKYKKETILSIIIFTYVGIFIMSYITKIGANAYLDTDGKTGFKGLFSSINEFSAIVGGLLLLVSSYLKEKKKYLSLVSIIIATIICSLLMGTKVLLGGIVVTVIYLLFKERKKIFVERTKLEKIIIVISLLFVLVIGGITFTKTRVYHNMQIQKDFFKVNNIISYDFLNRVIYNDRLSFLNTNYDYFINSKPINILFGIGINNYDVKMVEIDIFDIIFRYGIIGIVVFIFSFTKIKLNQLTQEEKITLLFFLIISLTSGHVLFYPNVCIYIGLLLAKNMVKSK